jgi:L-ascorbate metabolism protein UlaG (beta-lactamase superfamily)
MQEKSVHALRLTYIGGPTVLLEIGSLRLLTDPTFEAAGYAYVAGPQVIRKTVSPALPASALGPVDVVLLSHDQHGDNLDPAGRALLSQVPHTLSTPTSAQRLGGNAQGVGPWHTVTLTDSSGLSLRVTATPARHGPAEIQQATGDVTGWLLEWGHEPGHTLYISGDTVLFEGLEEVARRFPVNVALLHFGAAQAERFGPVSITLTAREGQRLAALLGEALIIPIHYEGWTHLTEGREEIEHAFLAAGQEHHVRFLPPGQPVSLDLSHQPSPSE